MKKVIIIGAGPAGITTAHELLVKSKEYQVAILEESNEIGGISRTVKYKGNRMDIGGHRFFSKNSRVINWWEKILPTQGSPAYDDKLLQRKVTLVQDGPNPEVEDRVMLSRTRISRIYYDKKFFDYPISMKLQTIKNMGLFTTIRAGLSYLVTIVFKHPEDSLENFYKNRFGKVLYAMFFESYTEKLWGRHPKGISADWGAQRVKGLSIVAIIKDICSKIIPQKKRAREKIETSLIEEFNYPKFGPGQLWELAATEVEQMGGLIKKNCKVVNVNVSKSKQVESVVVQHADGNFETIDGDIFISSMPLKDLITGFSQAPLEVVNVAKGLPYRDFVTIGLLVDKLNLVNETNRKTLGNIVPDCWIYVQDSGVKLGRIQIFNNWSPYLVENPEDTVWIGLEYFCDEGDSFWNLTEEESINFAIKELIKMDVIKSGENVRDAHRECVKKAYPAYFDTYKDIDKIIKYLDEFDNIYCIGRNGQHRYNNMDHSMETSFEVVNNILTGNTNKDNIWNVNAEKEYHEEEKGRNNT